MLGKILKGIAVVAAAAVAVNVAVNIYKELNKDTLHEHLQKKDKNPIYTTIVQIMESDNCKKVSVATMFEDGMVETETLSAENVIFNEGEVIEW